MVRLPTLIGLFHDMQTGDPVAIHRTALLSDGSGKDEQTPGLGNSKKMLGPSAGAAIMLSPFEEITLGLGICEGIETAVSIAQTGWREVWPTADWHERETYDLMGVRFVGHPNHRRILCPEDWVGYPLRKDYEMPLEYHGIRGR